MTSIKNLSDIPVQTISEGDFQCERQSITSALGSQMLGASVFKLPPNKKAFPYHFHYSNEEMIYVMSGEGSLKTPDGLKAIKAGDFIGLPINEDNAHQVINTSDAELVYLCISTMVAPDVMEYPDSGKVGVMAGNAPGGDKSLSKLKAFFKKDDAVGYFEGEE